MSTMMQQLREKAAANPQRIGFPEADEGKTLQAARQVLDLGIAYPILVGKPEAIDAAAESVGVSIDGMKVVDHTDEEKRDALIEQYMLTKSAMPGSVLKRMARDAMYYALMMQEVGDVDCTFAGLTHTTGDVIMAAQMIIGVKEGIETVSSLGIMDIPNFNGSEGSILVAADCAVCPAPTSGELADIAITTCETIENLLGWEPRAAMLSFSTDGSGAHESAEKVAEAVNIANVRRPDLKIDGEFQLDTAIVPEVAAKKLKRESTVAGKANIIIFPDLNSGNIGVKLVQNMAKCNSYGPLLQGFAKPISDSSRSAPLEEMVGNLTMLVVMAQKK
jgi:phosphate acetyltransferase